MIGDEDVAAFRECAPPDDDLEGWSPTDQSIGCGRSFPVADHVSLANALLDDLGPRDELVAAEGHVWRYSAGAGVYPRVERSLQSRIVQGYSGAPSGESNRPLKLKASDVSGAIKLAHDQIAQPDFFAEAPRGVVFTNGFLRVTTTGAELVSHSKDHRARAGYSFPYERGACPRQFLGFLDALFRDDDDRFEKQSFVQEFFGACAVGIATIFQRCMYGVGERGDNGKSKLAEIMLASMPPGTTSAIPPQDWGQEYRRAMFAGIHLNAVGELPERDILESEPVKAIISGDPILGRVIRESPAVIRPIAGHYFAANTLPGTSDHTEGFWRRPVVVTFNRSFKGDPTRDPHIATRILAAEKQAIVSWLVDGAVRLLRSGVYTIPPSHHVALAEWRRNADQIALFLEDETRVLGVAEDVKRHGTPAAELYAAYVRWAERNRHRPVASNTFGRRAKLRGHEPRKTETGWRYPIALQSALDRATADKLSARLTDSVSGESPEVSRG